MTEPLDLEPIKARLAAATQTSSPTPPTDIAALIAEVERLRGKERPPSGVTITMHDQPAIQHVPVPRVCRHCGRTA